MCEISNKEIPNCFGYIIS